MVSRAEPLLSTKVKTWAHAGRPGAAFLIALGALVITLTATLTFRRVTTPWSTLPDYDYWELISGLVTPNGLDLALANLFRHGNDHIVVIPKLIYAANYLITSGSNTGLIVYSIAVGAACAALLIFLARNLLHDTPWRLAACAVLFPLVMFSAKLGEVYFRGMGGTIWLTANLFVILSAAALANAIANGRPVWLFASLLAGLLGVLSNTTAVYSLIVLLGFCLALSFVPRFRGPMPTAAPITVATLIVIVLGLVITYRGKATLHLTFDPFALIRFVLAYLGNTLTMGPRKLEALLAPLIGFIILALGALAICRLIAERRINDALLWIILFLYAPFNGLVIGAARLIHDPNSWHASRYQSVAAISLIATIALLLAALPKASALRRTMLLRAAAAATLLIVAVVLAANRAHVGHYTRKNEIKVLSEITFRQGLESNEHLGGAIHAGNEERLARFLPDLRAAQHVPFNTVSRCEERLGQHFAETAGSSAGAIDVARVYALFGDKGQAMEVRGWAERDGTPAECIVIIDGDGMAIGAGASMLARPDIEHDQKRPLGRVGWRAVATLPQVMPVCALALFPGNDAPAPLANCAHSLAAELKPAGSAREP